MTAFQFRFMALTIDVIYRRGPSNEMCHQLQPKKTKVRLYLDVYIAAEDVLLCLSLLARQNASVLKVGVRYVWKMAKCVASYSQKRLK